VCPDLGGDSKNIEDYVGSCLNSHTSSMLQCIRAQVCSRGYKLVERRSPVPRPWGGFVGVCDASVWGLVDCLFLPFIVATAAKKEVRKRLLWLVSVASGGCRLLSGWPRVVILALSWVDTITSTVLPWPQLSSMEWTNVFSWGCRAPVRTRQRSLWPWWR
jgi:hypothetical protein